MLRKRKKLLTELKGSAWMVGGFEGGRPAATTAFAIY